MANPVSYVDPPERNTRKGGITSIASVREASDYHFAASMGFQYLSDGCSFLQPEAGLCFQNNPPAQTSVYQGVNTETGLLAPFAGYAGVECWLKEGNDYEARAERLLLQGEDRFIESNLATALDAADTSTTAGGAILAAIGLAEQEADANYIGQPILFMPRSALVAANATGAITVVDGVPQTVNQTPVIASGVLAPGKFWITGWITVFRSSIFTNKAFNLTLNREVAISERAYGAAIDCNFISEYSYT